MQSRKTVPTTPQITRGTQGPSLMRRECGCFLIGSIATNQPGGATPTAQNAFFGNLGTNNRTCFTCHQPQTGWTVSAASVQSRFNAGQGTDPIFRLIDGATCPSDDVSTVAARLQAYKLLLSKGLIRIFLPVPASAEYQILSVDDPYGCNLNPVTGYQFRTQRSEHRTGVGLSPTAAVD